MSGTGKMNWARGFFRVWVLLSCLWVVLVGGLAWEDYPDESSYVARTSTSGDNALREALTRSYGSTMWEDGNGSASLSMLKSALNVARETGTAADAFVIELAVIQASEKLAEHQMAHLRQRSIAAVALPASLLALGTFVAWVLNGFRRDVGQGD